MPEVKSHVQGEPCWVELATTDDKGALKFYSGLFGWKDDPQPMGPGLFYHMAQIGKSNAAGLYQMGDEEKGMPAHWRVYFSVKSADAAAKKATAAGGKVIVQPMDVMDAGRMVVTQDPSGAVVPFWEARKHTGFMVKDEPGTASWFELLTRDPKKAIPYYKAVLGMDSADSQMPGMTYTLLKVGGTDVAGVMEMPKEVPAMVPPYWTPYFNVANADASVKKAKSLGGKVIVPGTDIPGVGRFAVFLDPQGATFSVLQQAAR